MRRAWILVVALAACRNDPTVFEPIGGIDGGGDADPPPGIRVMITPEVATVSEGGQTTVQVRLSEAPTADRTIDIVGGARLTPTPAELTFTADSWAVNRTVILAAGQDDDADDSPVTVLFSGRGEVADGAAMVMITDDDELGLVVTPPVSLGVTEGRTAEAQVLLSARPTSNVVVAATTAEPSRATAAPAQLVFTPESWQTAQTVTITAATDDDTLNATTQLVLDPERDGMATRTVAVDITDDDVLAIDVAPTNVGTLTEAAGPAHTATIGVRLTQAPPGNLTVTLSASPAAVGLSPAQLTFTPSDYAVMRDVTITALADDDVVDEQVAIRLAGSGVADRFVQAAIDDDDVQVLEVTPAVVPPLAEGTGADVGVRLAHRPAGTVLVAVGSSAPEVAAVDTAQLTFTPANYAAAQTVRVTAMEDGDLADDTATITFNAAAEGLTETRAITVDDRDTQGLVVSTDTLAVGEGDQASFTVRLLHAPAGPITVSAATASAAVNVAPATLTFGPGTYATPQSITISGVQDADAADAMADVTISAPDAPARTVAVAVADDDALDIVVGPTALAMAEGASQTLMVSLAAQPSGNLTVALAAPSAVELSHTAVTFTPADYATPRPVVVTGADDGDVADETATIRLSAPGLADKSVAVDVADDDTVTPLLNPSPITVTEGVPDGTLRMRLSHDPGGTVTVTVASSAGLTVAPSSFTFDASNWSSGQAVTLTTFGDDTADDETESATFAIAGQGQAVLTVTVDDPTVIVGFTGPPAGAPYAPDQLAAFQANAMPACWVIDKIAFDVASAGPNARIQVGLYDQAGGEPARRVWQSLGYNLGPGTGVRTLDIGDVQVAPENPGIAWVAVDAGSQITLAARGAVPACTRDHSFASDLPDPFDDPAGVATCGMQPAVGVWLIGRLASGCP